MPARRGPPCKADLCGRARLRQPAPSGRLAGSACLVFILAPLAACGDDERAPLLSDQRPVAPVPGCEDESYEQCDVLDADCQRGVFDLMACLRGDAPGSVPMPPVQLLDEEGAIDLIATVLDDIGAEQDDSVDFLAEVRGLEMLGLLDVGLVETEADLIDVGVESLLAFYLIPTQEIVIIDRGDPIDDLDADAVLGHEMIHALQDAEHDLWEFGQRFSSSADRSLASTSLVEGEATFYQLLMMSAYMGASVDLLDYDRMFDFVVTNGDELTLEEGSPFVTAESIFPYTYGVRYAGQAWLAGGDAALDELFLSPPDTSLEIMFGGAAAGAEVDELSSAPAAPDGYALVTDDVAGAFMLRSVLAVHQLGEPASIETLARSWRGDRFWIYAGDGEAVASIWSVRFDGDPAAESFASMLEGFEVPAGELRVERVGSAVHVAVVDAAEDASGDMEAWMAALAAAPP